MRRLKKILVIMPVVLILGVLIFWLVARKKSNWDTFKGHTAKSELIQTNAYTAHKHVKWTTIRNFDLTMDIYTPKTGKSSYPVVLIFHGGAWLINDASIMDDMASYLASSGDFVVCNINYRLLTDFDNGVKFNEIVEDAFGAVLWVKSNIAEYQGNPDNIFITGDSSGAHLAAMVVFQGNELSSDGFGNEPNGFRPTWLPPGKTAEQVAMNNGLEVQGAVLNYGVFDMYAAAQGDFLGGFEKWSNIFWALASNAPRPIFDKGVSTDKNPEFYKKVSPNHNIPDVNEKNLPPMLFTAAGKDDLAKPVAIRALVSQIKEAGHTNVSYSEYKDLDHAFLDSGDQFEELATSPLNEMISFINDAISNDIMIESDKSLVKKGD